MLFFSVVLDLGFHVGCSRLPGWSRTHSLLLLLSRLVEKISFLSGGHLDATIDRWWSSVAWVDVWVHPQFYTFYRSLWVPLLSVTNGCWDASLLPKLFLRLWLSFPGLPIGTFLCCGSCCRNVVRFRYADVSLNVNKCRFGSFVCLQRGTLFGTVGWRKNTLWRHLIHVVSLSTVRGKK